MNSEPLPSESTLLQDVSAGYFESEGVWSDEPEPYQIQTRETLKALVPGDVQSILDVGCGNGIILNSLPDSLRVVGLDLSRTALRHVRHPVVQASATALPFADGSFDFVYSFDLIEHLQDEDLRKAVGELQRVARKYVLISVPLNEDIGINATKCLDCGTPYHINGHLRSFDPDVLLRLPVARDFERRAIFLSGDTSVPPLNPVLDLYRKAEIYPVQPHAKCPVCGSERQPAPVPADDPKRRFLDSLRSIEWAKTLREGASRNNRSEGMILLVRKGCSFDIPLPNGEQERLSPLDVDFCNPLQAVAPDFISGASWSRYAPGRDTVLTPEGLRLQDPNATQSFPTMIRVPVMPEPGDTIVIEASGNGTGSVSLYGVDGLSSAVLPLMEKQKIEGDRVHLEIALDAIWMPDRFGLALDLYIYGEGCVHRIAYSPRTKPDFRAAFAAVNPGLNLCPLAQQAGEDPVDLFWTYYAAQTGRTLLPVLAPKTRENGEKTPPPPSALTEAQARIKMLETALDRAESRCRKLEKLVAPLLFAKRAGKLLARMGLAALRKAGFCVRRGLFPHGMLNVDALLTYPDRWTPLDTKAGPFDGTRRRVLVLSYMFPHPDQPGLGSFVLSQVKALRAAGVDAAVISGRPYWITQTRNPLRALGLLIDFVRLHRAASKRWWRLEGVPVQYLPYPILGPFSTHGWSYRLMLRLQRRLWREGRIDLIHAHTAYLDGGAAQRLARHKNCPYIVTEHTGPFSSLMKKTAVRRASLDALRGAARIVAVSNALKSEMAFYLELPSDDRIQVIPNVVDTTRFFPPDTWHPDPQAPQILFVGYFVPVKNLPLLIEAFRRVVAVRPGARLSLVGGGEVPEQESAVRQAIKEKALEDHVAVRGYMDQAEVARLMREACDMLVLCSKSETFGCVVAEALASGKPAIVTDCGGPRDIVSEDALGFVCAPNEPEALAQAILALADRLPAIDPRALRLSVEQRFSGQAVAARIERLYRDVWGPQQP